MKMDENDILQNRKRYEEPSVTHLTREQAILKLRLYANQGDPGAKELLDLILAQESGNGSEH